MAWLTLGTADDDPVVLVRHLIRALSLAGVEVDAVQDLAELRDPPMQRMVVPELSACLQDDGDSFVLLIDDVHLLRRDDALEVLRCVLDATGAASTVGIAGRTLTGLHLARRELDGSALVWGERELAFSRPDATALIRGERPELPDQQVAQLVDVTEGWAAGLTLARMALRESSSPDVLIDDLLVDDRRVVEYLQEEVLDAAGPVLREFLMRAAVLGVLTVEACDEVLGRDDSTTVVDQLVASGNMFVVAIESAPGSYRIHQLFADHLVARLRRDAPGEEARLRRRAAQWYHRRGESDAAVRQALASGDLDFASDMVMRQVIPALNSGHAASLARWIQSFPPERVRDDGVLAICSGWAALSVGHAAELRHSLDAARRNRIDGPIGEGLPDYDVALAALEMMAGSGGVLATARHAAAVQAFGPMHNPWWPIAAHIEAVASWSAGMVDALEAFARAEMDTRGQPAVHAVATAHLGLAHLRRGEASTGQQLVRAAVEEMLAHGLETFSMAVNVHAIGALAAAERDDRALSVAAAKQAEPLLADRTGVMDRGVLHGRLLLAEAALVRGDTADARSNLREARRLLPTEPDALNLRRLADDVGARLDRNEAMGPARQLSDAEMRVLEQLPTHRSLAEIGEQLFVSRNTVKSHTVAIYRKLGVSGRSDAVDRARELQLIPQATAGSG